MDERKLHPRPINPKLAREKGARSWGAMGNVRQRS